MSFDISRKLVDAVFLFLGRPRQEKQRCCQRPVLNERCRGDVCDLYRHCARLQAGRSCGRSSWPCPRSGAWVLCYTCELVGKISAEAKTAMRRLLEKEGLTWSQPFSYLIRQSQALLGCSAGSWSVDGCSDQLDGSRPVFAALFDTHVVRALSGASTLQTYDSSTSAPFRTCKHYLGKQAKASNMVLMRKHRCDAVLGGGI